MLRVITANLNGIRSATKKGFFDWFADSKADVLCLQEVRAPESVLIDPIYNPSGYFCQHVEAKKRAIVG